MSMYLALTLNMMFKRAADHSVSGGQRLRSTSTVSLLLVIAGVIQRWTFLVVVLPMRMLLGLDFLNRFGGVLACG